MKRPSKEQRLLNELNDYNRRMRRLNIKEKTLKEYVQYMKGHSRLSKGSIHSLTPQTRYRRESPIVQSGDGIGSALPKKPELKYTGDKLLGIATMHKSNMVPVFKQEDAEDIANMRRN